MFLYATDTMGIFSMCSFDMSVLLPQERHRMKQLLAAQEILFPRLFASMQAAMKPLMARNRTGIESRCATMDKDIEESDLFEV